MVAKIANQIQQSSINMEQFIEDVVRKNLPEQVLRTYHDFPKYFRTTDRFKVRGPGVGYEIQIFTKELHPMCEKWDGEVLLDESEAVQFMKMWNAHESLKVSHEKLRQNIYNVLLQLGTYKRVQENFPEAIDYLPAPGQASVQTLTVNIHDVQAQIKALS
ncbi:MAG: hypothetical protein C0424_10540 [Sphingobacteriaceae bacterium]|nr:hypothetical protein [Sphingobacteriaceae bacterium]